MYYYIDDILLQQADYSTFGSEYEPPFHSMRIGSAASGVKGFSMKVPEQITYSNFKLYRYADSATPYVKSFTPGHNSVGNRMDTHISLTINKSFDFESAKAAFTIVPHVDGELKESGNTLYYELNELLASNTTYTITLASSFKVVGLRGSSDSIHSAGLM